MAGRHTIADWVPPVAAAALTSMLSLLELPVAWLTRRTGWSRRKAAIVSGAAIYLFGIPAPLGYGPLKDVAIGLIFLRAVAVIGGAARPVPRPRTSPPTTLHAGLRGNKPYT